MTLKEQIVQLSGDVPSNKVPMTLREEVIFLAEERLSERRSDDNVDICEQKETAEHIEGVQWTGAL